MTDTKEMVSCLRRMIWRSDEEHARIEREAADWIERWAPVEAIARRARQAAIACSSDKSAAAELRSVQLNRELIGALDAALGEDKP